MGNSTLKFNWAIQNEYPDVRKYIIKQQDNDWNTQRKIFLKVPEFELTKRNSQLNIFFKWPSVFSFKSVYIKFLDKEYHIECELEE